MSHSLAGAAIGAVLAICWLTLGFWAFVFVALAIGVGTLVAKTLDGSLNIREFAERVNIGRASSR